MLRIQNILKKIIAGDMYARIGIENKGELGDICQLIDTIINKYMISTNKFEEENADLNDSIIAMFETVTKLSQKDLTVKATVQENITAPIADALNMLTFETSNVLTQVLNIAEEVAETSNLVKSEADNVILLADNERNEVDQTVVELKSASNTIAKINDLAETSNAVAEAASKTTAAAMQSVQNTVSSIDKIRERIHEAEKRIKRLAERSQEISTAINLVNNISERTHILALNASMHAASAGEAGRGFAVVADEVQRLAESSREATSEISILVNNIQLETSNAIHTMNELISEIVAGNELAQQAGQKMQETQSRTTNLVGMVRNILQSATQQKHVGEQLRERADIIQKSVRKTGAHLKEQTVHTDELVQQALSLVAAISVFTLVEETEESNIAFDIEET
ncbi:type IV pilus biogenesis protein PilJ [uncultured Candidatus Thioglobus sp.]|nr:type IV pilus biogenesis protein PilJ [uncultured Candidatus Thioglobus sp.]